MESIALQQVSLPPDSGVSSPSDADGQTESMVVAPKRRRPMSPAGKANITASLKPYWEKRKAANAAKDTDHPELTGATTATSTVLAEVVGKHESVGMMASRPAAAVATAIVKVEKSEAPLLTPDGPDIAVLGFPPIDPVLLSHMNDHELFFRTKNACSIHKQAGAYAKEYLSEIKHRFVEGKKADKPYKGFTNFDVLCQKELEITSRQARNILNDNPGGRKGRKLPPRPKVSALRADYKRLTEYVKHLDAAHDRASAGLAQKVATPIGPTEQELERAKKDAVRDYRNDLTGVFCTSGSEREFTLEGSWYADQEI